MTSESDFRQALNEAPDDVHLRLVFADGLQDQGDERADGFRALAVLAHRPYWDRVSGWTFGNDKFKSQWSDEVTRRALLPSDWLDQLRFVSQSVDQNWAGNEELFVIENFAALAFARLPPERKDELLRLPSSA